MSRDTIEVPSPGHTPAASPAPQDNRQKRMVHIAAVAVGLSLVGSVMMSRHIERRLLFSRAALIGIAIELVMLALLQRRQVRQTLKLFFTSATHPLNLAIFRMAVFWAIFNEVQPSSILSFSRMPFGLRFAPWGMGALLPHLPIDATWAKIACVLLLVFCATGFVGIFSRTSALACALLSFYALGIPQFYGKVDHDHHLVWFVAILAVSPCGDFFALDAVVAAWKRADRGVTDAVPASQAYALPLRFIMLLMGVIYFFPGFWKLWQSGFDWFLSENLPGQLHLFWTWSFDGHWLPVFRIDQHEFLCRVAAGAAVLFELTFVFFMFSRKLRAAAAVAGLIFHSATNRFMRISFLSLRACYVALFDWASIFGFIGRALYREDVFCVYDGTRTATRRLVGFVRVWDIFGRVKYVNGADEKVLANLRLSQPEQGREWRALDAFAAAHKKSWTGLSACGALARRIPPLWPIVPILCFWPGVNRVSVIYKRPVVARLFRAATVPPLARSRRAQLVVVAVAGCILLVGNFTGGITRHINAWPFACYPTFSLPAPERIVFLDVTAVAPSGRETVVTNFGFPYHRFYGLTRNILAIEDPFVRNERLLLLWARAVQTNPELRTTTAVKFYVENLWTDPERWSRNPQDRRLLFVWYPASGGSIPAPQNNTIFTDVEWQ